MWQIVAVLRYPPLFGLEFSIMSSEVILECTNRIVRITFNCARTRNAFTPAMMQDLTTCFREVAACNDVRAVLLRAVGDDFCSGADIDGLSAILGLSGEQRASKFRNAIQNVILPLLKAGLAVPQPIVASIRGNAVGIGVSFALIADLVVASTTARFTLPQVNLAHNVDHGESWLLPRRIGLSRAMQMCLTGEPVGAVDAERFGLANWLVADEDLATASETLLKKLSSKSRASLWQTKSLLKMSEQRDFDNQYDAEREAAASGAASDEFIDAISALSARLNSSRD